MAQNDSHNDDDSLDLVPILEEPNAIELPEAGVGTLFSDDLPLMASKLTAIESFLKLLTTDVKFQDFVREVLLIFMKAVKSEAGAILECNHRDGTIFFRTAAGHASDQVVRFVIPMGQGIVGYVAESKQPFIVSNVNENSIHLKAITDAVGFNARNMVALPIIIRGKTFGVVELLNRVGEQDYTKADMDLLKSLCEFAAKTIEVRLMIAWRAQNKDNQKDAA
ncbi:MAG: GAF domain-containing protein [Bacteriovoracia bacterium]